jgi:hypothetical protein
MLLEDRSEIALNQLSQLINFINKIDMDNYYEPEQILNARKTLANLMQELAILDYKLDYVSHGY